MNFFHCYSCTLDLLCDLLPNEALYCPCCGKKSLYHVQTMSREEVLAFNLQRETEDLESEMGEQLKG
jgi:hypothetical protein